MKSTAIVLAAGQGKRMKSKVQKQFLELKGKPVLYYSLACFEKSEEIQEILVVTGEESIEFVKKEMIEIYGFQKVKAVVAGGKERYDSVYNGLLACEDCDYVFIHDGARPFVTEEMIRRGKEAVLQYGACAVGMPSKDTIKMVDDQGIVVCTPDRNRVWNIQTPQIFSYKEIRDAHEKARTGDLSKVTDDAMIMEMYGNRKIKLVEGSYENIKLTTPEDILLAEKLLEKNVEKN